MFLLLFLLFHGGSNAPKVPQSRRTIDSYAATDAVARLTIDGPVNAEQNHEAVRITVGQNEVTYEQLQGYEQNVVNSQTFASNQTAYVNFLLALSRAGFTQGSSDPTLKDERGYCPIGRRYVLEFSQGGKDIERYWTTTCGSPKTYLGNFPLTFALFRAQVPHYDTLTRAVKL